MRPHTREALRAARAAHSASRPCSTDLDSAPVRAPPKTVRLRPPLNTAAVRRDGPHDSTRARRGLPEAHSGSGRLLAPRGPRKTGPGLRSAAAAAALTARRSPSPEAHLARTLRCASPFHPSPATTLAGQPNHKSPLRFELVSRTSIPPPPPPQQRVPESRSFARRTVTCTMPVVPAPYSTPPPQSREPTILWCAGGTILCCR